MMPQVFVYLIFILSARLSRYCSPGLADKLRLREVNAPKDTLHTKPFPRCWGQQTLIVLPHNPASLEHEGLDH